MEYKEEENEKPKETTTAAEIKIEEVEKQVEQTFEEFNHSTYGKMFADRLNPLSTIDNIKMFVFFRILLNIAIFLISYPHAEMNKLLKFFFGLCIFISMCDSIVCFLIYFKIHILLFILVGMLAAITKFSLVFVVSCLAYRLKSSLFLIVGIEFILLCLVVDFCFIWIVRQAVKRNEDEEATKVEKMETVTVQV